MTQKSSESFSKGRSSRAPNERALYQDRFWYHLFLNYLQLRLILVKRNGALTGVRRFSADAADGHRCGRASEQLHSSNGTSEWEWASPEEFGVQEKLSLQSSKSCW